MCVYIFPGKYYAVLVEKIQKYKRFIRVQNCYEVHAPEKHVTGEQNKNSKHLPICEVACTMKKSEIKIWRIQKVIDLGKCSIFRKSNLHHPEKLF